MAGNIKGVTIEIGGNTTKLNAALKNISKKSNKLDSELKKINNSLKFNPKNTDLLKQKFDVVNKAVKETQTKLEELKKIEAQLKGNPEHEEHWRKVQREIIFTENKLKSLEKEQKAFNFELSRLGKLSNNFKSIGESAERVGKKFEDAGNKAKPLSLAMTGVGVASVAAFKEVDEMLDTVVLKTGATGDNLKDLQQTATNVFTSHVAPSALEAGNAVGELNTRFNFTGETLEKSSIDFLKFAKVTGQDVNNAIIKVSRTMGDAGIPANEYNKILDALTVAGQASGISVDKLSETLTKFGAPMRQLGFDINESIALFSSWEKAGVNTEIAFSGMKKAIGNWAKEGKDARIEFKKTLEEIKNTPDIATATTKAIEIFGQKAGPDLADAIKGGRFEYSEMLNLIESSDGTLDKTFNNQRDATEGFKVALNNLKVAGAELGQQILEVLAPILKSFAEKLKEWTKRFKELDPATKQIIVKIGLFAAAFTPLSIGIGKTIGAFGRLSKGIGTTIKFFKVGESGVSSFGKVISKMTGVVKKIGGLGKTIIKFVSKFNLLSKAKTAINGITVAFRSLKLAFATNPLGIAILALTALGTALVIAYKKSEKFKNIVDKSWAKVKEVIKLTWENVIKPVFDKLKEVWTSIVQKWEENSERIKFIFTTVWEFIVSIFRNTWEIITGIWEIFAGIFTRDWDRVWNGVKTVVTTIWEQIKQAFSLVFDAIWSVVSTVIQKIYDWISEKFTQVSNFIFSTWENIKNTISNAISTAWNIVVDKVTSIYNSVSEWFGRIPGTISNLWGQAQNFLSSINLYDIGQNIIQGLANGLESAFGWVREKARNIAQGILNAAKSVLGINSPSRKMMEIGVFTGQGLSIGLDETKDEIKDKSKELSDTVLSSFDDTTLQGSLTTSYELSQNSNVISVLNGVVKELNGLKQNFNITSVVEVDGQEIARATHKNIDYLNGLNYKKLKGVW